MNILLKMVLDSIKGLFCDKPEYQGYHGVYDKQKEVIRIKPVAG